ncbi:RRP15-like protein [Impatiens glandulifera]|uniref:RRP15-like protein n=1 Tax=Impatiens glandulifera TaxID=253017 RepID=UPI001FB14B75|nr:RRP15-like protein [Impatiens glandulifera]
MVEEEVVVGQEIDGGGENQRKRRMGQKKGGKTKKKLKVIPVGPENKVKIDRKMKKLIRKRVRDYNSDDDVEEKEIDVNLQEDVEDDDEENSSDEEDVEAKTGKEDDASDDEDGEVQPGITKLTEGCNAFRLAFKKIMKKSVSDNLLGPVLSAHKKLLAEKLAEDDVELKAKGALKKEKHLVGERGHVKPANFLDAHDKFLIGVATKGVVKLFNAVNKAQHAQKGLDPSRSKDAKVIRKRRKEAFFSELGKKSSQTKTQSEGEGPAWAPLRDNYMLTNSKLKNWNKMPDPNVTEDIGRMGSDEGSSDED